jgi:hypothetical protein
VTYASTFVVHMMYVRTYAHWYHYALLQSMTHNKLFCEASAIKQARQPSAAPTQTSSSYFSAQLRCPVITMRVAEVAAVAATTLTSAALLR